MSTRPNLMSHEIRLASRSNDYNSAIFHTHYVTLYAQPVELGSLVFSTLKFLSQTPEKRQILPKKNCYSSNVKPSRTAHFVNSATE